ncbi:hypothetical protein [Sphingomonas sp. GC_Shp_6]|uniref:hypothetical protein n=1 Tax=Sphingomonas sp. GC_Shp_6 TaxID=2937378 RepID=UPI00226ACD76|nr:hypothetical protein [Sphingomonas sp. GC_Shp_6]
MPPLVDLPGHIGRYRILVEAGQAPLARHWAVHWSLIGNLGVDLLVVGLHPWLDVEPAARLIVTLIPLATVMAMLWAAREAHGRLPAGAALALPLAYAYPFQLGFVNFCLAQAMAIAGLALWLRLAKTRPTFCRVLVFAPIALVIWLCHSFGWAMLGVFVFGAEWQLGRMAGLSPLRSALRAALFCVPMALPLIAMAASDDPMVGETGDWLNGVGKAQWIASILRERWRVWDVSGVILMACVLWTAVRSRRLGFAPLLGVPALLGLGAFLILPRLFQGGSYVDMRMLPASVALALLAIRVKPGERTIARRLAIMATGFLIARTVVTTIAFLFYAQGQVAVLRALPALPIGGGVLVLVDEPSSRQWSQPRFTHIAGIAIARRRVFQNEQWSLPGQQPIRPLHSGAAPFESDPSQLVYPRNGEFRTTDFDDAVARFDRCTYGSVWTIGFPAGRAQAADLRLVWHDGRSAVYRLRHGAHAACR